MARRYHTRIDLSPLRGIIKAIAQGRSVPMRWCFQQWGKRYGVFIRGDFKRQSGGGGRWPVLSPETIARRKKEGKGAKILRNLGHLLTALDIGAPGNRFELMKTGCLFGFGGPAKHPGGKARIADIARFHDEGTNRLPQRKIIVPPDGATVAAMGGDLKRAISRMG